MLSRNFFSNWTKLPVPAAAFFIAAVAALTIVSSETMAKAECVPVNGHIDSQQVLPPPFGTCTSPVGLCTSGTFIGGIQGNFNFTATSFIPSPEPTIPSVFLFTGLTVIQTKDGDSLFGSNAGSIDFNPFGDGHFADLITFTGGTGSLAGASGHIVAFGNVNFATGVSTSDYKGELCTP